MFLEVLLCSVFIEQLLRFMIIEDFMIIEAVLNVLHVMDFLIMEVFSNNLYCDDISNNVLQQYNIVI